MRKFLSISYFHSASSFYFSFAVS